ncbi:hypothetical protein BX666DRAFT_2031690 [Dichotomocladium elegans]|nr:hypothetical protein BX666DRAFT_2031690 [Dichotomocladium elegans]
MTFAITAEFTSPLENHNFSAPLIADPNTTDIQQLTSAIKIMQAELNQYLTKRMAASNESADLSKDDDEEDDYDENENNEDTLQRRADIVPEATLKKQRTA